MGRANGSREIKLFAWGWLGKGNVEHTSPAWNYNPRGESKRPDGFPHPALTCDVPETIPVS